MYLETQLKAWKGKADSEPKRQSKKHVKTVATRRNDPNGLMQHIAADLTDAEIKAVAAYFASFGDSNEPFDDSQHRLR
jgi:cytochrome c553